MKFYQLGFRYLQRKKGKTILLLIVLILVNSMILGTSMILRTTNESRQAMQEKTNSKIVAEITSKDSKITENEVNKIETLEDVSSINRIGRQEVFPNDFAPVTLNTSTNEENLKIALLSYDDLEKDSPFSEMQYRLASGDYIKREKKGAVINANLANQNELKVGDTIELSTENGTKVSVQIIGIFMSAGNAEKDQPSETTAVNRIENQIFIDNSTYKELFKEAEFEKICIYSKRPEKLDVLETSLQKIFGNDVALSTSDTLYQQMSAPLEQISKVANLMLVLTLVTGTVVVSLLLCMWMRTRQKEVAIFMSLGKTKSEIFLQTLLEAGSVFTLSVLGATAISLMLSFAVAPAVSKATANYLVSQQVQQMQEEEKNNEGKVSTEYVAPKQDVQSISVEVTPEMYLLDGVSVLVLITASVLVSGIVILKRNPKDILSEMS